MVKIVEFDLSSMSQERTSNFRRAANNMPFNPYTSPDFSQDYMTRQLGDIFPEKIKETLYSMGQYATSDLLVLRNLPCDSPVPRHEDIEKRVRLKGLVSEGVTLGIAGLMGCYVGQNPKEQNGKPFHNIAPVKGHEKKVSSKGRDPFYLHIENPFQEKPPEFLMLFGLEGDENAKTTYFFIEDIMVHIPDDIIECMKKPEFEIRSGAGLDAEEKGVYPLLKEQDGVLRLRLYEKMERITPLTADARKTLDALSAIFESKEIQDNIQGISLQQGEAIICNNGWSVMPLNKYSGVMHGRGGHVTNPCRWLGRSFFYRQQAADKDKISAGLYQTLNTMMTHNKRYTIKEAADMLRDTMLSADDASEYTVENPEATPAQVALYGVKPQATKLNWLKRIIEEKQNSKSVLDKITILLESRGIEHRKIFHESEGRSKEAAAVRGNKLSQGAKALTVRAKGKSGDINYFLAVIPADQKLNLKLLKKHLKIKDVSMLSPDSAKVITGCEIGAIPPFSFNKALRVLVDPALYENEEIVFNAGRKDCSIFMRSSDFRKLQAIDEVVMTNEVVAVPQAKPALV